MKKKIRNTLSAVCLLLTVSPMAGLGQDIVHDQQPDSSVAAIIDQEIPDFPDLSTYAMNDIFMPTSTFIDRVTVYFTNDSGRWADEISEARLSVTTSPFDNYDPKQDGQIVPVDVENLGGNVLSITAFGVLIPAAQGEVWIGLSPIAGADVQQEFRYSSSMLEGEFSVARNPGGGFGLGSEWMPADMLLATFADASMTVSTTTLLSSFLPDSLNVFRGVVVSGTLVDLLSDDDQLAVYQPGFTINSEEAPVWLILDGTSTINEPGGSVFIESQAGTPGLTLTVEEFNFSTNSYEVIGTTAESFNTDTARQFVRSGHMDANNSVRMRIGWRRTGFTINFPWEVRVDAAKWFVP